jgi:hypothetical protein
MGGSRLFCAFYGLDNPTKAGVVPKLLSLYFERSGLVDRPCVHFRADRFLSGHCLTGNRSLFDE